MFNYWNDLQDFQYSLHNPISYSTLLSIFIDILLLSSHVPQDIAALLWLWLLFTFSTEHFTWSWSGFPFKICANPQQMAGLRKYRQKKPKKKRSQKTLRDCTHARAAAFVLNPKTVISRAFIPWTATAADGEGSRGLRRRRRRRRRRCLLQLQLAQSEVR